MELKKIEEFILLAKKYAVGELKYENEDVSISVNFGGSKVNYQNSFTEPNLTISDQVESQISSVDIKPVGKPSNKSSSNFVEVKSPFVGTFYISPSPGSEPFGKVGQSVSPGQVLCIIEAMKIMNEIESDVSGIIDEICIENETYVEFGQTLFKIRKS